MLGVRQPPAPLYYPVGLGLALKVTLLPSPPPSSCYGTYHDPWASSLTAGLMSPHLRLNRDRLCVMSAIEWLLLEMALSKH